jgi:5'-nucleotidase
MTAEKLFGNRRILRIAVSIPALLDSTDGDRVFKEKGGEAYDEYVRAKADIPMKPGPAFPLIKKILALNTPGQRRDVAEVVLVTKSSPEGIIRAMNSIHHHELDIERAICTQGGPRIQYLRALGVHLVLSTNEQDVAEALAHGIGAARVVSRETAFRDDGILRIAVDLDSTLFSDESDLINQQEGLKKFQENEMAKVDVPLAAGPLMGLLIEIAHIQKRYPTEKAPIRIVAATARGTKAAVRAINTARAWGLRFDEAIFSGGLPKGPLLAASGVDFFFDDTLKHVESAEAHDVPSGHVPYGNGHGIVATP